jgi:uncharacterized protein YjbI with pentapeptide repeats
LEPADRAARLAGLGPGADVDVRGSTFTADLLRRLLDAVRDPATGRPAFGEALFTGATFLGETRWTGVSFAGNARFGGAKFVGDAWFVDAAFGGTARFGAADFSGAARFDRAVFSGDARFPGAVFQRRACFADAAFSGMGRFGGAVFRDTAEFGGAVFDGTARFARARFEGTSHVGPLVCGGRLELSSAVFAEPVTIEAAASEVVCHATRWDSTAILRLRHAVVDLADARLTQPVAVVGRFPPLLPGTGEGARAEQALGRDPGVRVVSVRGVDASLLTLADVDLERCLFSGALHLDQLRLEGRWTLGTAPAGWHIRGPAPVRWTRRQVIEEERQWRTLPGRPAPARGGWGAAPPDPETVPGLASLTTVYRQLRKAREDSKDEPGAADFYYGEMEMRRHSFGPRRAERWLLQAYWLLSGYGLRASRALAWLFAAMSVSVLALTLWGLPTSEPKPRTTGTVPAAGREISLSTDVPPPTLSGPMSERISGARVEKAVRIVINSVVFRSGGQPLTTAGSYVEMTSRIVEPGLLALALLAVRGRIRR